MVDREVVAAKVAAIRDAVDRVRRTLPPTAGELAADRDRREIVALNLLVALQSCLALAAHWLADEGRQVPQSYRAVMLSLAEEGVLEVGLARRLGDAAGLRNLIAHQYARLDWERIHVLASQRLGDLEDFCSELSRRAATV